MFLCFTDGGLLHPFHLHGHYFYVLAQGVFEKPFANMSKEEVNKWMNQEWELHDRLPIKDTVSVPPYGYVVIRIDFNNPGKLLYTSMLNTHNTTISVQEKLSHIQILYKKCHGIRF